METEGTHTSTLGMQTGRKKDKRRENGGQCEGENLSLNQPGLN